MGFNEDALEQIFISKFEDQGYDYIEGDKLNRDLSEVLLVNDLRAFLKNKYKDKNITDNEIENRITYFKNVSAIPVFEANKEVFTKLSEGETLRREDPREKDFHMTYFDFENPENNIFKVVNQLTIEGAETSRIPDMIVYINGFPVAVFEFKSTVREDATIHDAFDQITIRYKRDIPELFKYNGINVISDGVNTKMGSLFGDYEHYHSWRRVEPEDRPVPSGAETLDSLIEGLFRKDRIIDYLHNFVFFPDKTLNKKIVASYPQYFAARLLYENLLKHMKPEGDGKGGTFFGTTGCGKSFIMVFLSRLIMRDKTLKSPTILLITDRTDLDNQLSKDFQDAKNFIGDNRIKSIESRSNLRETLEETTSGGVFLTTVQKFEEDFKKLTDRNNIIVISDEAHRTQNNLEENVKYKDEEVLKSYGFAKYAHDSLPNATFIGFTGTPIEKTIDVFGDIVDSYTMTDSVEDGVTVRLIYDGKLAKMSLDEKKAKEIEEYYEECLRTGSNEYQVEASKKNFGIKEIIGDHDRLNTVADYFIEHYENHVEEGSVAGQAMFVAADRKIAYDFYNILKEKRPEWFVEKLSENQESLSDEEKTKLKPLPMVKLIATRGKDDPEDMYDLLGTDEDRRIAAQDFKDINSNFKVAIVVDMWTTGFDVPQLDVIYLDKPISKEHALIQTISRVNRAYEGKDSGLIVDFFGNYKGLMKALNTYTDFGGAEVEMVDDAVKLVKNEIEVLSDMLYPMDLSPFFNGTPSEAWDIIKRGAEKIMGSKKQEKLFMKNVRTLSSAFKLCNSKHEFTREEVDKVHLFQGIRSYIVKLTKPRAVDTSTMNKHVREMIEKAVESEGIEELFTVDNEFNIKEINLFSPEFIKKIKEFGENNTKVRALERLIKKQVKETKKTNKVKSVEFDKRLKQIIDKYNTRTLENKEQAEQVIREVLEELSNLIDEIINDRNSFKDLGIDIEEKAFFDILTAIAEKYKFDFPKDKSLKLAKEIKQIVDKETKQTDWENQMDVKAQMQVAIIITLSKEGYPPIEGSYEPVYKEIIEQAENFKKNLSK